MLSILYQNTLVLFILFFTVQISAQNVLTGRTIEEALAKIGIEEVNQLEVQDLSQILELDLNILKDSELLKYFDRLNKLSVKVYYGNDFVIHNLDSLNTLKIQNAPMLQNFDVSLSSLRVLSLGNSQIHTLTSMNSPNLEDFDLGDSDLISLDLREYEYLEKLNIKASKLEGLHLPKKLKELNVNSTEVPVLNLSEQDSLNKFISRDNLFSNIIFSSTQNIDRLSIDESPKLKWINFPKGIEINSLSITNCGTEKANINDIKNLRRLYIISTNINEVIVDSLKQLEGLDIKDNEKPITDLDIRNNSKLSRLVLSNVEIQKVEISQYEELVLLVIYDSFIDTVKLSDCSSLKKAELRMAYISEFQVENCESLESLILLGNRLKSLDISTLSKLRRLIANRNNIETLILPKDSGLNWLSASSNNLKTMDFSNQKNLVYVSLDSNPSIRSLDFSSCPKIESLDFDRLETLTLSRPLIKLNHVSNKYDKLIIAEND